MLESATTASTERARTGPPAFAALDLGTNNCRLLVGAPAGDGFRVLDSFCRIVRLGEGLHHTGRLSQTAMDRALAALHACAARLARRPVRGLRAIATEACRRAANGARVPGPRAAPRPACRSASSPPARRPSWRWKAARRCWRDGGRRALLFDIGGGSTELAWVRLPARRRARRS